MIKGWFIGEFSPHAFFSGNCEVAYKKYKKGFQDEKHYHKQAVEITLIVRGTVQLNQKTYEQGEIIVIEKGEISEFSTLSDVESVVVKIPGTVDDKYIVE